MKDTCKRTGGQHLLADFESSTEYGVGRLVVLAKVSALIGLKIENKNKNKKNLSNSNNRT